METFEKQQDGGGGGGDAAAAAVAGPLSVEQQPLPPTGQANLEFLKFHSSGDKCPACGAPALTTEELQIVRKPGRRSKRDPTDPRNRSENLVTANFLWQHIETAGMSLRDISFYHGYTISTLSRRAKQEGVQVGSKPRMLHKAAHAPAVPMALDASNGHAGAAAAAAALHAHQQKGAAAAAGKHQAPFPEHGPAKRPRRAAALPSRIKAGISAGRQLSLGSDTEGEEEDDDEDLTLGMREQRVQQQQHQQALQQPMQLLLPGVMPEMLPVGVADPMLPFTAILPSAGPIKLEGLPLDLSHLPPLLAPMQPPPQQQQAPALVPAAAPAPAAADEDEAEAAVAGLMGLRNHQPHSAQDWLTQMFQQQPGHDGLPGAATVGSQLSAQSLAPLLGGSEPQGLPTVQLGVVAPLRPASGPPPAVKQEVKAAEGGGADAEGALAWLPSSAPSAEEPAGAAEDAAAADDAALAPSTAPICEPRLGSQQEQQQGQQQQAAVKEEPIKEEAASEEQGQAGSESDGGLQQQRQQADVANVKQEDELLQQGAEQQAAKELQQQGGAEQQGHTVHAGGAASESPATGGRAPEDPASQRAAGASPGSPCTAQAAQAQVAPAGSANAQQAAGPYGAADTGAASSLASGREAAPVQPLAQVREMAGQHVLRQAVAAFRAADMDSSDSMLRPLRRLQLAGKGGSTLHDVIGGWASYSLSQQQDIFSTAVMVATSSKPHWEQLEDELKLALELAA